MITRFALVCVGVAILQSGCEAQEYATKDDVAALRAEFSSAMDGLSHQIASLKSPGSQADDGLVPVDPEAGSATSRLERRVKALEDAQRDMILVQRDQGTAIGQIAMKGDGGNYHWQFDSNSQSARNEFKKAIESTVPNHGTLLLHNKTGHDQRIVVNGYQHTIASGAKLKLDVPTGTVTSRP
jgi:hypothetical protein